MGFCEPYRQRQKHLESMVSEVDATQLHNLAVTLALQVIFKDKIALNDEVIEHLSSCFRDALKHLQKNGH